MKAAETADRLGVSASTVRDRDGPQMAEHQRDHEPRWLLGRRDLCRGTATQRRVQK
jgi:hypothetical protein